MMIGRRERELKKLYDSTEEISEPKACNQNPSPIFYFEGIRVLFFLELYNLFGGGESLIAAK